MGGGIGMGNTCKPMAVLFQCMTKFTTNKKKKEKKKKKNEYCVLPLTLFSPPPTKGEERCQENRL